MVGSKVFDFFPHIWLPALDFGQAEQQFEKILTIDPCRIDDIDIYSNILYVTDNRLKLSRLAHEFLALEKDRPEICCLVGEFGLWFQSGYRHSLNGQHRESLFTSGWTWESCEIFSAGYSAWQNVSFGLDPNGARIRRDEEFTCCDWSLPASCR